jgi:two-component system LytT family response regulator
VDDEPPARKGLRRLLEQDPQIEVVGECADGASAVAMIKTKKPELVFLDVHMPGVSGIDALRSFQPEDLPIIVFVTAFDRYALQAFEVHATDYLLKPIKEERLRLTLRKVKTLLSRGQSEAVQQKMLLLIDHLTKRPSPLQSSDGPADRISVKVGRNIVFVKTSDIDWIEATKDYAKLHVGLSVYLIRKTMANLEASLGGERFIRIHRSTIVNVDRIKEMVPLFAGDYAILLQDGKKLTLTRKHRNNLKKVMRSFTWQE